MKRLITILGLLAPLAAVLGLAIPSIAQASPWNRNCGSSRDGFLSPKEDYEVTGPWHVGMQAKTAASIARRVGVEELGYHETAKSVACAVPQDVASAATTAYDDSWPRISGTVGVGWIGYSEGPYLGRFHCVGSNYGRGSHESCHHDADSHAGAITVTFLIQQYSS